MINRYVLIISTTLLLSAALLSELHSHVTHWVNKRAVFRLIGQHGGGTGFQIHLENGDKIIITNDHVCGVADEGRIIVDSPYAQIQKVSVIRRSQETDLCILEGVEELPALELGSSSLIPGNYIDIYGHPLLGPLVHSYGTIKDSEIIDVAEFQINTGEEDKCSGPKHHIEMGIFGGYCIERVLAQRTSAVIKPGSSGSPVLDRSGRVRGVAFAGDSQNKNSFIIPLKDLLTFLSQYEHRP